MDKLLSTFTTSIDSFTTVTHFSILSPSRTLRPSTAQESWPTFSHKNWLKLSTMSTRPCSTVVVRSQSEEPLPTSTSKPRPGYSKVALTHRPSQEPQSPPSSVMISPCQSGERPSSPLPHGSSASCTTTSPWSFHPSKTYLQSPKLLRPSSRPTLASKPTIPSSTHSTWLMLNAVPNGAHKDEPYKVIFETTVWQQ